MKKESTTHISGNRRPAARPLIRAMAGLAAAMLVLLPFHAFLTVWASSLAGHYTLLRLWKEALLALLVIGGLVVCVQERRQLFAGALPAAGFLRRHLLVSLIAAYLVLLVIAGAAALPAGAVTPKTFAYGLLLDARFLVFFLVVWLVSGYSSWIIDHWRPVLLVPAAIVVVFGLLQFTVLPNDFLSHFGYGPDTIAAVQTIDQKDDYQRVQSTLRGANPLGAYLVLIIAAAGGLITSGQPQWRRRTALLFAGACTVLALTFSRSAWLGTLAALGWLLLQAVRSARSRQILLVAGCAALLVFAAAGYGLRNNDAFQNAFLHTDENSRSAISSNQGHANAAKRAVDDITAQPFGRGTGTAGPASAYNPDHGRIAENYFLQIGQEAGVIGLALFIAISLLLGLGLWRRRSHPLPQVLLASLIGITVVNMLSHAWTDDTLAYVWWGLAGAAMTLPQYYPRVFTKSTEK